MEAFFIVLSFLLCNFQFVLCNVQVAQDGLKIALCDHRFALSNPLFTMRSPVCTMRFPVWASFQHWHCNAVVWVKIHMTIYIYYWESSGAVNAVKSSLCHLSWMVLVKSFTSLSATNVCSVSHVVRPNAYCLIYVLLDSFFAPLPTRQFVHNNNYCFRQIQIKLCFESIVI